MKRAIITSAVLAGTALGELKDWLAITASTQDTALEKLLRASLDLCEGFTGTMPLEAVCEEVLPAHCEWQALTTRPVHAITEVTGMPAEGPHFALAVDTYAIELEADGTGLVRVIRQGAAGRIAVRFVAGFAPDWDTLPGGLRHGILRLAAHYYRERDSGRASEPPAAVTALWRPWRRLRVA